RLACAVRADDPEELALPDLEPDSGDDLCASDVEPEITGDEDGWSCRHLRLYLRRGERPDRGLDVAGRDPLQHRGPPLAVHLAQLRLEHGLEHRMVLRADALG